MDARGRARCALLVAPCLLLLAAPTTWASAPGPAAVAGSRCHGDQTVESLQVRLGSGPTVLRPGSLVAVPVSVVRGAVPAGGVQVLAVLRSRSGATTYRGGTTDATGAAVLQVPVPAGGGAGVAVLADASHQLVGLPCLGAVVEHGEARADWSGKAR